MSGKLDQSLDQIMSDRKTTNPRQGRRRPARGAAQRAKAAIAAPAGGIKKNTKAAKPATKAAAPASASGNSKILVANLPTDVSEAQVKDFFSKAIGNVRNVIISYGPNGRSRGEATVVFGKSHLAADAVKQYNGVKIDNKAMRVEVVGGLSVAAATEKSLKDRIAKPKNAAKEKTATGPKKATANGTAKAKGKKSGRAGRPKAKTADELDAEMQDYFGGGQATDNAAANGQAATNGAQAAGGDTGMTDEVL